LTAIAGRVRFGREGTRQDCSERLLISDHRNARTVGRATFSTGSFGAIATGEPFGGRGHLLVGEIRLDNRNAIAARLNIPHGLLADCSDAELLLEAWRQAGEGALEWIRGDYAFAVWDNAKDKLALVRGPLSGSQLFYCAGKEAISFASTPGATIEIAGTGRNLDVESAARFLAGVPSPGRRSFFAGVARLPHSHIARIGRGKLDVRRFWEPMRRPSAKQDGEYAGTLADLLDRAVSARVANRSGGVGAQLSSGRDSGAVVTSAARQLAGMGDRLIAFTAAPSRDFAATEPVGLLADESGLAGDTAALYPNLDHCIVRPDGDPMEGLEAVHSLLPNPVAHLSNFPWSRDIERAAKKAALEVLLTGNMGNFTISAGGGSHLSSVLHEDGAFAWLRACRTILRSHTDLLRIANWTFGAMLPASLHRAGLRITGNTPLEPRSLRMLRQPYAEQVRAETIRETCDQRPPRNEFELRKAMIMDQDPTNTPSRLLHGIDVRDPTADRDLIDFCFTIPARLLAAPENSRPLFDRAFASRLGWSNGPRPKGYQAADWDRLFSRERVRRAFGYCRAHPIVSELLDLDYLDSLIARWPSNWNDRAVMLHYRNDLLGALSFAHFVRTNF
jgi:asparagine synthase (glutamine-hydrolysing)